jgi:hypothetical protein
MERNLQCQILCVTLRNLAQFPTGQHIQRKAIYVLYKLALLRKMDLYSGVL